MSRDPQVTVTHFVRRADRVSAKNDEFTNLYVKNLPESYTEERLKELFEEFGTPQSVAIMTTGEGKSKCFGFVNMDTHKAAMVCSNFFLPSCACLARR